MFIELKLNMNNSSIRYEEAIVWYLNYELGSYEIHNTDTIDCVLQSNIDIENYLSIYKQIGGAWQWSERLIINREELHHILAKDTTEVYYVYSNEDIIGYFELDFSIKPEIIYFGLTPNTIGKGYGKTMMFALLNILKIRNIKEVMLHTCSNDSKRALSFYQNCGFKIYDEKIEKQTIIKE